MSGPTRTPATFRDCEVLRAAIDGNREAIYQSLLLARRIDRRILTALERSTSNLSRAAGILEAKMLMWEDVDNG